MTNFESGLVFVDRREIPFLVHNATQRGYRTYSISTAGGSGRVAFFDAVRAMQPQDPPVVSSRSWDALSDSLWSGIHSSDDENIAIIWDDSLRFSEDSPEEFNEACSMLADIAASLADPGFTAGKPKRMCVFVSRE